MIAKFWVPNWLFNHFLHHLCLKFIVCGESEWFILVMVSLYLLIENWKELTCCHWALSYSDTVLHIQNLSFRKDEEVSHVSPHKCAFVSFSCCPPYPFHLLVIFILPLPTENPRADFSNPLYFFLPSLLSWVKIWPEITLIFSILFIE